MKLILTSFVFLLIEFPFFAQTFDTTFQCQIGANATIYSAIPIHDDKIFVVGDFNEYNNMPHEGAVLLNSDGSTDESFVAQWSQPDSYVKMHACDYQSDGKFLAAGTFNYPNFQSVSCVKRLMANGTVDFSFNTTVNSTYENEFRACKVQSDGKIIIGGAFQQIEGIDVNGLARLNSDGSLDTTFHSPVIPSHSFRNVLLLQNGQYLVYGFFDTINGLPQHGLVRLNHDGSVDLTFHTGSGPTFNPASSGNAAILDAVEQPDGKIILAGYVTYYNGSPVKNIFRLNSDGTLDNSMQNPSWVNGTLVDLNLQVDGKIIVLGDFEYYNTTYSPGIIRLNPDGSIDQSFHCGEGPSQQNGLESFFLGNNKVIVYGPYTEFDGHVAKRIARLNVDPVLGLNEDLEESFDIYPNPTNDLVTISFDGNNANYIIYDAQGKLIQTSKINSGGSVSLKDVQTGVYFFQLTTENGSTVKRVVKN